jgi:hypothetical protein
MQWVEQSKQKSPSWYFQQTAKASFCRWTLNTHPQGAGYEQ